MVHEDSADSIRSEIASMRQEAAARLAKLNDQVQKSHNPFSETTKAQVVEKRREQEPKLVDKVPGEDAFFQAKPSDPLSLLDGTQWKVMFNIGREPGKVTLPAID